MSSLSMILRFCIKQKRSMQPTAFRLRKSHDAVAVLFGLKFTDNIHYKFKTSQASKAMLQSSELQTYQRKTEFNAKWPKTI